MLDDILSLSVLLRILSIIRAAIFKPRPRVAGLHSDPSTSEVLANATVQEIQCHGSGYTMFRIPKIHLDATALFAHQFIGPLPRVHQTNDDDNEEMPPFV
ncbi:hypothetical protein DFH08DRAFT_1043926 [Mycena albidolilacea]|uniref:Uncharacterized protein n=1 Tax=Mycena albidolilacea TaxID=1033008 RepID=A0AAD6Z924_9AGAR|nr:hypothetical protein DFH08DRAFT_1043926 [Mycena albidolilacea]